MDKIGVMKSIFKFLHLLFSKSCKIGIYFKFGALLAHNKYWQTDDKLTLTGACLATPIFNAPRPIYGTYKTGQSYLIQRLSAAHTIGNQYRRQSLAIRVEGQREF